MSEHEELMSKVNRKVPWIVFVWAIGIILAILTFIISQTTAANAKVDNALSIVSDLKANIASIQTDVGNIKDNVSYLRDKLR